MVGKADVET